MVVRSCLLLIGDENAAGTRPLSELTAINPAFDDVQADCYIYESTWQQLHPGINTDPGTDKWSFESRWREGLRAKVPSGNVYVIKHTATAGTLTYDSTKPCWFPMSASAYAAMLAKVTAAAAAAAPDTIRIDAIGICIFAAEVLLQKGWRSYGAKMRELIDLLRADLAAYAGSLRGDGAAIPVVVVAPHAEFSTGYSDAQRAVIMSIRSQCEQLASETDRVAVMPTQLATCTDGLKFDAASLATLGYAMPAMWYPPVAVDDSAFAEAPIALLIGDSIIEGSGLSPHPSHLTGAQANVNIWVPYKGAFESLQIGTNNLVSLNSSSNFMGLDSPLGDALRAELGSIYIVKCALFGGFLTSRRERAVLPFGPLRDIWRHDFDPADRNGMFDATIRGWLPEAVRQLRSQSKKPRVKLINVFLGTNDVLSAIDPVRIVAAMRRFVDFLRAELRTLAIDGGTTPSVILNLPANNSGTVLNSLIAASLEGVREGLQVWAEEDSTIKLQDTAGYGTNDGLHLSTAGTMAWAADLMETWKKTYDATIQPLFVPTKAMLTKALRLSRVNKNNDAKHQIDEAITASRVELYRSLGEARVAAILGMAYSANPVTANDHTRLLASTVETKMVKRELMRVLPMMFMDGSNAAQAWSEEAAFREGSYLQTRDELRRLEDDIRTGLTLLLSSSTYSQADVVFPDTFHSPGATLYGEAI